MKTSVVLLVVLVFNVQALQLNFSSEYEPQVRQIRKECAKIENVDFKYLTRLDQIDNYPTHEELNCVTLCVIHKFNALDSENRYKVEIVRNFFADPIFQEHAEKAMKMCLPEDRKINTCEDADNVYECFLSKL